MFEDNALARATKHMYVEHRLAAAPQFAQPSPGRHPPRCRDAAGTDVSIAFSSNPILGLVDADIAPSILGALHCNPATHSFEFTSDVMLFDGLVEIPDNVSDFHLSLNESSIAPTVPEPRTFLLFGLGLFGLVVGLRRKYSPDLEC